MAIRLTLENFIIRARLKHGDVYNYDKVLYKSSRKGIIITCPIHGDFEQVAESHLKGLGCNKCIPCKNMRWTKERFISELLVRNKLNELSYEIVSDYKGTTKNVLIKNKYGVCSIRANHLLNGVMPSIELALNKNEYWINKAREKIGDIYDYSKVNYVNSSSKIVIICKIHGEFLQTPNSHLSGKGCSKCRYKEGGLKLSKRYSDNFIKFANKKHSGKYVYETGKIFRAKDIISILCPIHGKFNQIADNHLRRDGCPRCGLVNLSNRIRLNPIGWSHTNWEKASKRSKNFDSFKVYIIKCWNDDEEFYKIGKTFTKISKRFRGKADLPYKYKVIKEILGDSLSTSKLEITLKNCNKINKYIPKIKFAGMYECFDKLDMSCFEEYNLNL